MAAPGCLSSRASASSAVTKSPGTNSPCSSMKKQRSASPSQAMPRSAFSATTRARISRLFSSSSGLGAWLGKVPSTAKNISTRSMGVPLNTRGASLPATPLAASMTTR